MDVRLAQPVRALNLIIARTRRCLAPLRSAIGSELDSRELTFDSGQGIVRTLEVALPVTMNTVTDDEQLPASIHLCDVDGEVSGKSDHLVREDIVAVHATA